MLYKVIMLIKSDLYRALTHDSLYAQTFIAYNSLTNNRPRDISL